MTNKHPAKRLPPPVVENNSPIPRERREDVPSGMELLEEWTEGQTQQPVISYADLAEKYNCSTSLIHRRISSVANQSAVDFRKSQKATPLEREMRITQNIIEAFSQLWENCGPDAVERALKNVEMHLYLDRNKE